MDLNSPACVWLRHPQPRDSGDYVHRVLLPGQALSRFLSSLELQTTHPEHARISLKADLLLIGMLADPVVLHIVKMRKERGLPTVYEISDDFRDFPPSLPGHAFYNQPSNQALIEATAGAADLLQFSSHGLQRKYAHLNAHNVVFSNQLEDVPDLPPVSAERRARPVLGWAGSVGHHDDAARLAAWLRAWLKSQPSLKARPPVFRVMAADSIVKLFKDCGLQVESRLPGSFQEYLEFLSGIDIGFAVLGKTDFSAGRSDGKFLEYASRGVLCVASRGGEYDHGIRHGETGLLFDNTPSFIQALNTVFNNPQQRARMVEAAHQHLRQHRIHALAARKRYQYYRQLLASHARDTGSESGELSGGLQSWVAPAEKLLMDASIHHGQGQLEQALGLYLQVLETCPDFYLPWHRGGLVAQAMGRQADAALFFQAATQRLEQQLARS